MIFQPISLENWERREYFEHYFSQVPCTYSITVKLDITPLIRAKVRLYPSMLYCLAVVVNRHREFRMAFDKAGRLGFFTQMHPCYTVFHKDSETFSNLWTEYTDDYRVFCRAYRDDVEKYKDTPGFMPKPGAPDNLFNVSMLPWESFEGFNLNLQDMTICFPSLPWGGIMSIAAEFFCHWSFRSITRSVTVSTSAASSQS